MIEDERPAATAPAILLLTAWEDLDWAIRDISSDDMLRRVGCGHSCWPSTRPAWT